MTAPAASTSETRGASTAKDGKANGDGGVKQPRKRGRKRIDEDLTQIKGNTDLDADAKRKLQNRAAQRAFRERKEKHLSDLETRVQVQEQQLNEFSEVIRNLVAENEALRRGEQPASVSTRASLALANFRNNTSSSSTASPPPPLHVPSTHSESPQDVKPLIPATAAYPSPAAADLSSALLSTSLPPVPSSSFLPQVPPDYTATLPRDLSPPRPAPTDALRAPVPLSVEPAPLQDVDMTFDFDAPFTFDDTTALPPLFSTLIDELLAPSSPAGGILTGPSTISTSVPAQPDDDDPCPCEDSPVVIDGDGDGADIPSAEDDPPPLPGGRIPCDKPECDFSTQSCLLPIPWRPPTAIGTDRDLWVAQKCWAKLLSHPLFGQCDSDELCQELRDRTRCSDDGRLVVAKNDVCDIFRSIPAKAKVRAAQVAMQ